MVKIRKEIIGRLITHAKNDAPLEACGYLCEKDGVIVDQIALRNMDRSGAHFTFDPKEQFDAIRAARDTGLKPVAVYHSHPQTPARLSAEDIRLAYDPNISYVIVSLASKSPDIKLFKIVKGAVTPEDMVIIDE